MDDVLAGSIAVEDLEQEQVDGRDGVERPPSPAMADGLTGVGDRPRAEPGGEVLPEASEDGSEPRWHGGLRPVRGVVSNTIVPGVLPMLNTS
jgi:hypothetical protein